MIKRIIFFAFFGLFGCQSDTVDGPIEGDEKSVEMNVAVKSLLDQRTNLNISILVDLSDRIDPLKYPNPTMEYYQRDIGYVRSVITAFSNHVMNKKLLLINDRIQTFIDPPPLNSSIVDNLHELKVELNKDNVSKEFLNNLSKNYTSNSESLYEEAISDHAYVGSDTWRFFKSSVKDYCIRPGCHNILVVLTDGYIYHKDSKIIEKERTTYIGKSTFTKLGLKGTDWKTQMESRDLGFIPATTGLSELKVIVVGLNPARDNPFEEDILTAYWENWLMEMGVKDYLVKKADFPINLDESIQSFILTP